MAALTTANYISLMEHALGKTPDARHSLLATFNRAGRALVQKHNWKWRIKEATVLAVANVNYLELPTDFGAMRTAYIDAASNAGDYSRVVAVRMEEIALLRQALDADAANPTTLRIAWPDYTSSATDTTQPTLLAPCWPTPTDNGDPTINLNYLCVWRECDQSASEVPNIPPEFEEALRLCAIYAALTTENIKGAYPEIKAQRDEAVAELIVADARKQMESGRVTGGASSRSQSHGRRHVLAMPINL